MTLELAYKVKGYRFDLGEGKFRYRLDPREDELLSSWLIRIALCHLAEPATFVNLYLPRWRNILWARDVDVWADNDLLETLSLKSGIAYEILHKLTLKFYEGYLSETINPKTRNPFIQNLVNCCRVKIGCGLRFCPDCLRADDIPYFRKKWRLSFSTA
jgi:hypothetical protein